MNTQIPFTQREAAAIALKVPASGTPWLDQMIRESRMFNAASRLLPPIMDDFDKGNLARQAHYVAEKLDDQFSTRA